MGLVNGFAIAPDAPSGYSRPWMREMARGVERCEHGPMCRKCCHFFRRLDVLHMQGLLIQRDPASDRPWIDRVRLPMFFWEMSYGPQPLRPKKTRIFHTCTESLCVNLHHLYRGRTTTENAFWSGVRVCEHGHFCEDCCWPWKGRQFVTVYKNLQATFCLPNIPGKHSKFHGQVHRIAYFLTFGRYPDPQQNGIRICTEGVELCCNPHHIRFIPRAVRAKYEYNTIAHNFGRSRKQQPLTLVA